MLVLDQGTSGEELYVFGGWYLGNMRTNEVQKYDGAANFVEVTEMVMPKAFSHFVILQLDEDR